MKKTITGVAKKIRNYLKIDYGLVMQASRIAMTNFANKQFQTSGTYGGKPWDFYSNEPKYKAYKQALGASPMPLRWKAGMERIYPALTNPNNSSSVWSNAASKVILKITIPYLSRIEKGGTNQFGEKFPGRPIFSNANGRFQREVTDAIKEEFKRQMDKVQQDQK